MHPQAFPLSVSADGRYLQDRDGAPFPILGRAAWFLASLSASDRQTFLADTASRGYNALEALALTHDPRGNHPPFDGGNNAPFLKRLDGASWSGSLSYANLNSEAPDFTTPNETYWAGVDTLVADCASQGILLLLFPAYVGYAGGGQGWMQEMVANGPSRMQSYGAWIANRYKNSGNIVWMMGGDMGSFTQAQNDAEAALLTGLKSISGQQSTFFSAEWDSETVATDQPAFGSSMNLNGVYSFSGQLAGLGRRAYARTPVQSAFLLEEPYDQEGPDGNGANPNALQPVRRFQWWGLLSSIGGYLSGNGYVWPFVSPYWQSHLDTQGSRDMARLNAFVRSIPWYQLVPSGLAGLKTLVTSGASTPDSSDYVAAAASPDGKLLVLYVPPAHTGGITVDLSAMSAPARARWFNPATGLFTDLTGGLFSLPNSAPYSFSPPGDNGTGYSDWVLLLEASLGTSAPPTVASAATASPNPVSGRSTNLSVLGADDGGEASLLYSWSASGPAPVAFSPNSTNSAKTSVAAFAKAGSYLLQVSIGDAQGQTVTSSLGLTVNQTLSGIAVTPASATVAPGGTQQFSASATDQFGAALSPQPAFLWTMDGGGAIGSSGLFTAGALTGGPFTVTATANSLSGTARLTVANSSLTIGEPNVLSIDDSQNANLLIAQKATLGQPATIQSLSFYVTAAAGKLRLGIYDASGPAGAPGVKKAETGELTPQLGWNTASVIAPLPLPAGTYWLAYLPSSNSLHFRRAGAGSARYYAYTYGLMPLAFSSTPVNIADHWSFSASLSP